MLALKAGVEVTPVWNKSNREHTIIGSEPSSTRAAADSAVAGLGWKGSYFCDADHIGLKTVERFLAPCDFFTIDVAELIGKTAEAGAAHAFATRHSELTGSLTIPGIERTFGVESEFVREVASKFLAAVEEAARVYRYIEGKKGVGAFVTEVSMDETDRPQSPVELLIILAAIADARIPLQTIAPKFTGRFNKGVDYVGDLEKFRQEFAEDLAVVRFAVEQYGLPANLKLSVHSGSDKFSIYRPMHQELARTGAGVHVKTAGTTWLEELIGLAESGGAGLEMAKLIYWEAYDHREELCAPYAAVIDIDNASLPLPRDVDHWNSCDYTGALRHESANAAYNSNLRQLLHVGFKVAAKLGNSYLNLLDEARDVVGRNVTANLFDRHIKPIFLT